MPPTGPTSASRSPQNVAFEFHWNVANFVKIAQSIRPEECLHSPVFTDPSGHTRWHAKLHATPVLTVAVCLESTTPLPGQLSVAILDSASTRFHVCTTAAALPFDRSGHSLKLAPLERLLEQRDILLHYDGTLKLQIRLELQGSVRGGDGYDDDDDYADGRQSKGRMYEPFQYNWRIPSFRKLNLGALRSVISPIFTDPAGKSRWFGELFPHGASPNFLNNLSAYLWLESPIPVKARASVSILDFRGNRYNNDRFCELFHPSTSTAWGIDRMISRKCLLKHADLLLSGGVLTVQFRIEILRENNAPVELDLKFPRSRYNLATELKRRYPPDVILEVGGAQIPTHRLVLAGVSSYFARLLAQAPSDECPYRINLPEVEASTIRAMLQFIYREGKLRANVSPEAVGKLLEAGKRFEIRPLEVACERHLAINLNIGNTTATLAVAERIRSTKLTKHVIDFLRTRSIEVMTRTVQRALGERDNLARIMQFIQV